MELKYTIEILTKDIQDIEKLVGNLRNSEDPSTIDLDLALSKLRNIYEILSLIKSDRLSELINERIVLKQPAVESKPEAVERSDAVETRPEAVDSTRAEPADSSILAERFSAESSINENLAGKRGYHIDSKLSGQAIDNISRNIGINDRFFIIRELFQGDAEQFMELVGRLDSAENCETALGILEKQFSENMDHQGVIILSGLVKRRHIR
ncbi:MAG: hypothetical protein P1P86_08945 [Bacteroidales bacterium]|nr:hypothetical protein [Bacteroidales bacterium]